MTSPAPLPRLVAEFRAIMSDPMGDAPSPEHCRAAIEHVAAAHPAGPEMWALWYVQAGARVAELCEFDGSICFECYRDAGEAETVAARLNEGASLGRYVVATAPNGVACGNEEVGTVRVSGPVIPWIGGMDGGFTTCTANVTDLCRPSGAALDVRAVASRFHASDAAWQAGLVAAFGRRASDARYTAAGQGELGSALRALYVARHAAYSAWCEANALPPAHCPVAMVAQPVQQQQGQAVDRDRLTGSAYWANRGAKALHALARKETDAGMHGNAASFANDANECERYLDLHGVRDAAAPEMLHALRVAEAALAATLGARGYRAGSCVDEWSAEVRGEAAALASVRAAIAKARA
jgi:hypothetical protein